MSNELYICIIIKNNINKRLDSRNEEIMFKKIKKKYKWKANNSIVSGIDYKSTMF